MCEVALHFCFGFKQTSFKFQGSAEARVLGLISRAHQQSSLEDQSIGPQGTLPQWHEGKTGTETLAIQKVP